MSNLVLDPDYKGRVELTQQEAEERKLCIGKMNYTVVVSLLSCIFIKSHFGS